MAPSKVACEDGSWLVDFIVMAKDMTFLSYTIASTCSFEHQTRIMPVAWFSNRKG